jgi:predicted signal transduction protein with EAL and GGDEF domain
MKPRIPCVPNAVNVRFQGVRPGLAGLRTLGCPVAQGFYFSHPLRAEEFDELLTRHFARTTDLQGQL